MNSLYSLLKKHSEHEGFPLCGAVDIDLAFTDAQNSIGPHIEHFDQWLAAGFAANMDYLHRGRDRRANPHLVFPEAQSIFCVALPYPKKRAGAPSSNQGPRYARYLQGTDYHLHIAEKLERVLQKVKAHTSAELRWKICVDTSAVLERSWAALAGLGWIGKNTLLIHPKFGSYLFLGEALLNQKTHRAPSPVPNYCGHCTRCLKACPPQALETKGQLNSNRCMSYWTLEKRGPLELPELDQRKIGSWIAGCDICQEVCPFNRKPAQMTDPDWGSSATTLQEWRDLLAETPEQYRSRVKASALNRVKYSQFSRNLSITLQNEIQNGNLLLNPESADLFLTLVNRRISSETELWMQREWKKVQALLVRLSPNRIP